MKKLSVVLATRNEEENIGRCLAAVEKIADEIIIFDEFSSDDTVKIAKEHGAKVFLESHHDNFHITKQKAIDKAKGDWILQLDADEVVTKELAKEITSVISMSDEEIKSRMPRSKYHQRLFERHMSLIEKRDGKLGKVNGEIVAFFIPRINMFLGRPLVHAGRYPDPAIRLIKKGKAHLPARSVHEIMEIDGEVQWLFSDLLHYDSPTLKRYLSRMNRYTDLDVVKLTNNKTPKNFFYIFYFTFVKPLQVFTLQYFRHRGYLDGLRGFLWAFLSAMHFPLAYYKYFTDQQSAKITI